jgi:hypothetical protein
MPLVTGPSSAIQPVQLPDMVGDYAKLAMLKNQLQEAPLRQQALQQQVQAGQQSLQNGQLSLQKEQQDQQDQQSFRAAMQDPSLHGKTIGEIADVLAQKGAISQGSWVAAKKADTEQRTALTNLDEKQAANLKNAYASTMPIYSNVMQMDDAQMAQNWPQIAQQYDAIWQPIMQENPKMFANRPLLDPNHPMTKQQLAQFGPMLQMGQSYADQEDARRKAQTDQKISDATLAEKNATARFYQQNGGAPGVSAELIQQADWQQKNPGKGPSDFLAWKARQAPLAQFNLMNNTGAGAPAADVAKRFGYTPEAFDQAAERFAATGVLPPTGRGGAALAANKAIMNRAGELHAGESISANSAEYKANSDSLKKLTAFNDNATAFEQTASKNFDLLQGTLKDIPDLGAKFANVPARMISSSMIGTDAMARFHTALNVAQTEAAKVLNNPNSGAVLSDSARGDLQKIIDGNLPVSAIVASLDTLRKDMKNRLGSNAETIANIRKRLGNPSATPAPAPAAAPAGGSNNDPFSQFGGFKH